MAVKKSEQTRRCVSRHACRCRMAPRVTDMSSEQSDGRLSTRLMERSSDWSSGQPARCSTCAMLLPCRLSAVRCGSEPMSGSRSRWLKLTLMERSEGRKDESSGVRDEKRSSKSQHAAVGDQSELCVMMMQRCSHTG